MIKNFVLCFSLMLLAINAQAKNWDSLFDHAQYKNAKISPDGRHFAVAILHEERTALVFLQRDTMQAVGKISFTGRSEVGEFHWVNNERVVIEIVEHRAGLEKPLSYGELYSANIDGSKAKLIYGFRAAEKQTGSKIKKTKPTRGWGKIIDTLSEDEKHILISSTPMSTTGERLASVLKLNVYTGKINGNGSRSPIPNAHFLTDGSGQLRALIGTDKNNDEQLYVRRQDKWQAVAQGIVGTSVRGIAVSPSGKYLYTLDNIKQDLDGLFKLNLEDLSYKSVYTDKMVDVTDIEMTTDARSAYAIRVDEGYPSYLILNGKLEEAKVFKDLLKSFPYSKVSITSKTQKGDVYIVSVSSDIAPGNIYLFDKEKNELSFLFQFKPGIKSEELAEVEPIQLTASDGQVINGYFTAAKPSTNNKIAPLVVLVHGGPHGVRDYWSFSAKVQYLALNGYSVLQVNYRGSGGYGRNFEVAGHRAWGSISQQDIHDAYLWLVSQNKASANNACIMGASFGAYSAIQSAAIFPDSYKCAIANAGIYDLELMFEEGDIQNRRAGMSYLKMVLGTDKQKLKGMSPVNYVEKIQVPLLLAHGEDDERAPYAHAERLREALDDAKKPYEWFVVDKEGHGFYNPENQKAYMRKVLSFLNSHLPT